MVEVRIPPGNRMLSFQMAEKLIKSAWYEAAGAPPDSAGARTAGSLFKV